MSAALPTVTSALTRLRKGEIGLLYERDTTSDRKSVDIIFTRLTIEDWSKQFSDEESVGPPVRRQRTFAIGS